MIASQKTDASAQALELRRAHGTVRVVALDGDRFAIRAPAHDDEIVLGFDAACERAQTLARGLE